MTCAEQLARLKKAIRMADVIWIAGLRYADLIDGAAGESFWQIAVQGAGFHADYEPSPETKEEVLRLIRERSLMESDLWQKKRA